MSSWNEDGTVRVEGDFDIGFDGWIPNTYALDSVSITQSDSSAQAPLTLQLALDPATWPVVVDGSGAASSRRVHFVATGALPDTEIGFCPSETFYQITVGLLSSDGAPAGSTGATAFNLCADCPGADGVIASAMDWLSFSQQPPGKVDLLREVAVDPNGDVFVVVSSVNGLYLERIGKDNTFKRLEFDPAFESFITSGRMVVGEEPGVVVYWGDLGAPRTLTKLERTGAPTWSHVVGIASHNVALTASGGRVFFAVGDVGGATLDNVPLDAPAGTTVLASVDEASGEVLGTSATEMVVLDMLPGPNGTFALLGGNEASSLLEVRDKDLSLIWSTPLRPAQVYVPAAMGASGHVFVAESHSVYEYQPGGESELHATLPHIVTSLAPLEGDELIAGGSGIVSRVAADGATSALTSLGATLPWCPLASEYRVGAGGASAAVAFVIFNEVGAPELFAGRVRPTP